MLSSNSIDTLSPREQSVNITLTSITDQFMVGRIFHNYTQEELNLRRTKLVTDHNRQAYQEIQERSGAFVPLATASGSQIAPDVIRSSISSATKPYSARISRLCSPTRGAPRRIEVGVAEYFTGWAITPWVPPVEAGTRSIIPRAIVCESSLISLTS